ncbi:MAG: RdgB/HAM1 family non-canonical purine NTP pyrophosphatase [Armatimonadetes bacterium]|nr:RdgB/HAM1 family non-canonical purine NTP pyrophosphatase [Armatimonadota bacterium]
MRELVLATRNRGKVRELSALVAELRVKVLSLDDVPSAPEVEETGPTFLDNARLKAHLVAQAAGLPALADDSGLEADALDGEPGVYSARYGGPGLDDAGRCALVLERLTARGVESSPARFRCAVVVARPDGNEVACEARWEGIVHGPPRGGNGFGYDPIFEDPVFGQTAAELGEAVKNRVSHRAKALAALALVLREDPDWLVP